jgi:hypothetical protein
VLLLVWFLNDSVATFLKLSYESNGIIREEGLKAAPLKTQVLVMLKEYCYGLKGRSNLIKGILTDSLVR